MKKFIKLTDEERKQNNTKSQRKYYAVNKEKLDLQSKIRQKKYALKRWSDAGFDYLPKIHLGSLGHKIYLGVKDGLKLNVSEWAKRLKISEGHVVAILTSLREHGYHFHPIGTQTGIGHKSVKGYIVDITDSLEYFNEANNRAYTQRINPGIKRAFNRLEKFLISHPDQSSLVESEATNLLLLTVQTKKEFEEKRKELYAPA